MFPSLIINLLWHILTSQLPSLEFMVYFWALVPSPFYIVTYLPQWVHINFYANYSYFFCALQVQACHVIQYFSNLEILLDASRFLLFHISSINRAMHSILKAYFESRLSFFTVTTNIHFTIPNCFTHPPHDFITILSKCSQYLPRNPFKSWWFPAWHI